VEADQQAVEVEGEKEVVKVQDEEEGEIKNGGRRQRGQGVAVGSLVPTAAQHLVLRLHPSLRLNLIDCRWIINC
jgi:hypothetical protein